jgi:hypothetical protein
MQKFFKTFSNPDIGNKPKKSIRQDIAKKGDDKLDMIFEKPKQRRKYRMGVK